MSLLRIAVPNKGSLSQSASEILREAGYRQRDDARQLTFEMVSFLEAANTRSLLHASAEPYRRAETALRSRLTALGADPALVASIGASPA